MKTYKYKTLSGLLRNADGNRITLDNIITGRFIHKNNTWCTFELDYDEKCKVINMLAKVVSSSRPNDYAHYMWSTTHTCGLYTRLWFSAKRGAEYCSGQDGAGEIRYIQYLLRTK